MNVVLFLQRYVSTLCHEDIQGFSKATIDTIKTNPYRLSDEVFGIGFKTAEDCDEPWYRPSSIYRICGLRYILTRAAGTAIPIAMGCLRNMPRGCWRRFNSLEDALVSLQR